MKCEMSPLKVSFMGILLFWLNMYVKMYGEKSKYSRESNKTGAFQILKLT